MLNVNVCKYPIAITRVETESICCIPGSKAFAMEYEELNDRIYENQREICANTQDIASKNSGSPW